MKTTQIIVRSLAVAAIAVSLVCFSGCKCRGSNDPDEPQKPDTVSPVVPDTVTPVVPPATHDRPAWTVADTTDLESTMTVTGRLPSLLCFAADTTDLVAAFADSTCWGVTSIRRVNDKPYFFLYITRPRSATHTSSVMLTLRYYCAKTRYLYVQRDTVEFVVDSHIGSISAPFVPAFAENE